MFNDTTVDDLVQILRNTIVLYDKEPVHILEINNKDEIVGRMLSSKENGLYNLSDDKFSFEPFSLGFTNGEEGCFYLSRKPARQYKQGLTTETMYLSYLGEFREKINWLDSFKNFRKYKELRDVIVGNYESLDKVLESVSDKTKQRAISRSFAVTRDGSLYFKDAFVGILDFNTHKPNFLRNKIHLDWLWERRYESV